MARKKARNGLKLLFAVALIIYILCVLHITIFSREPEERRFDLEPFRSYVLLIRDHNSFYLSQICCNILMTVPFGILLPFLSGKFRSLRVMTVSGFFFSLIIEILQYISGRGLFEFDDLFNNTVGSSLGYIVFLIIQTMLCRFISDNK